MSEGQRSHITNGSEHYMEPAPEGVEEAQENRSNFLFCWVLFSAEMEHYSK